MEAKDLNTKVDGKADTLDLIYTGAFTGKTVCVTIVYRYRSPVDILLP